LFRRERGREEGKEELILYDLDMFLSKGSNSVQLGA
jgi:hypothetical protein